MPRKNNLCVRFWLRTTQHVGQLFRFCCPPFPLGEYDGQHGGAQGTQGLTTGTYTHACGTHGTSIGPQGHGGGAGQGQTVTGIQQLGGQQGGHTHPISQELLPLLPFCLTIFIKIYKKFWNCLTTVLECQINITYISRVT